MPARDPRASPHDLGGHPRFRCTPVEPDDNAPPDAFGRRVDALRQLLATRGLLTVDELRRSIEAIPEAEYHALSYYERWLRAMAALMQEKDVVLAEELR
ncbi:nitrile hydratase [Roseomonas elaeocarpi]|uniref:Nitrile hydratase n=1 Tax=Roseomonas elaeocarpi TaxID=907779 RepID=A0ABV6JSY3_9PROT